MSAMSEERKPIGPVKKGLLHKNLGIPAKQKIGMSRLQKALHSHSAAIRKEANFAVNMHHGN